eukprot:CFRG2496T1
MLGTEDDAERDCSKLTADVSVLQTKARSGATLSAAVTHAAACASSTAAEATVKSKWTVTPEILSTQHIPELDGLYENIQRVDAGAFGTVFKATTKPYMREKLCGMKDVALKYVYCNSSLKRRQDEIFYIRELQSSPNIIRVLTCHWERDNTAIVLEYFPHDNPNDYLRSMTVKETVTYMRALFVALCGLETRKIIHRDIKPANFLWNRKAGTFALCDFGLAERQVRKRPSTKRPRDRATGSTLLNDSPVSSSRRNGTSTSTSGSSSFYSPVKHKRVCMTTSRDISPTASPRPAGRACIPTVGSMLLASPIARRTTLSARSKVSTSDGVHTNDMDSLLTTSCKTRSKSSATTSKTKHPTSTKKSVTFSAAEKLHQQQQSSHDLLTVRESTPIPCTTFGAWGLLQVETRRVNNGRCAGTRGFRPPEAVLGIERERHFTTVDTWAAGVILLCIMTRRYPFFRAKTDDNAVDELIRLFGKNNMKKACSKMGLDLVVHEKEDTKHPLLEDGHSLRLVVEEIAQKRSPDGSEDWPDEMYNLLQECLTLDHHERILASEALQHPLFANYNTS